MEMPDIHLAHADLNKYNQTPNHLADHHLWIDFVFRGKVLIYNIYIYIYIYIHTYIYIHVAFQESHSKFVNKRQKISYIFILIFILLNNFINMPHYEGFIT